MALLEVDPKAPAAGPFEPEAITPTPSFHTGMEPLIRKTPGVSGGDACLGNHRVPVWLMVEFRQLGLGDDELLTRYPRLMRAELEAGWKYADLHADEIGEAIRANAAV